MGLPDAGGRRETMTYSLPRTTAHFEMDATVAIES